MKLGVHPIAARGDLGAASRLSFSVIGVAAYVNYNCARQNQDIILTVGDVDTVAIGPGEILFRDGGDLTALPSEGIFIIE